jgi:hypothetical protein
LFGLFGFLVQRNQINQINQTPAPRRETVLCSCSYPPVRAEVQRQAMRWPHLLLVYLVRETVLSLSFVEPNKPDQPDEPDSRHELRHGSEYHILNNMDKLAKLIIM